MIALPANFTPIKDAELAKAHDFIGIVLSSKHPYQTRGQDCALEFTIQDDFTTGTVGDGSSMRCRFFRRDMDDLPVAAQGDIAIIHNAKVTMHAGNLNVVSNAVSVAEVFVFPAKGIGPQELGQAIQLGNHKLPFSSTPRFNRPPTAQEHMAVVELKAAAAPFLPQVQDFTAQKPTQPTPYAAPSRSKKAALIKDLIPRSYHDIRVQVVKFFYHNHLSVTDVYVTDYTKNDQLFFYEDPDDAEFPEISRGRQWRGPFGQYTLQVRLYGANNAWARENLKEGDYVLLRNIHAKTSLENKLEAALHEDHLDHSQVDICRLYIQSDINAIEMRREEYEAQRSAKSATVNVPVKASAKAAKRKKDKRAQKQQEEALEKQIEEEEAARAGINTHVRAGYLDIQHSSLAEIAHNPHLKFTTPQREFDLPFVNCKYRTRVRVVDFFPPDLRDFVHSTDDPEWNPPLERTGYSDDAWEWAFVLLLEDVNVAKGAEAARLRVVVNNMNAQGLLKMDAVNFNEHPHVLTQLEEKLFILWGNLLELKSELQPKGVEFPLPYKDPRLQNLPFDCCIEEYGAEVPVSSRYPHGLQRTHGLFGTVISDDSL